MEEYRRSIYVLALIATSYEWLSVALLTQGEVKEAKATLETGADLVSAPGDRSGMLRIFTTAAQDNEAALQSLEDPDVALPAPTIAAYRLALRALITRDPKARADAVKALASLPPPHMGGTGVLLLASLGANTEALRIVETGTATGTRPWRAYLFYPSFAAARADPAFPAVAERLGLMRYWKRTHTKPDVCSERDPAPFCGMN